MSKGTILVVGSNATELEAKGGGTITIGQFLERNRCPADDARRRRLRFRPRHPDRREAAHGQGLRCADLLRPGRRGPHQGPQLLQQRSCDERRPDDPLGDRWQDLIGSPGVFFPGGHAPIVDVMQDPDAGEVLRYFHGAQQAAPPRSATARSAFLAALDKAREFRAALIDGNKVKARELARAGSTPAIA